MADASYTTGKVRIGTWNTEFAKPGSVRGERVRPILAAPECDILCVTEGCAAVFPDDGDTIEGGNDPCYPLEEGQRTVLLWRSLGKTASGAWRCRRADSVAGTTRTPIGRLTVVGVCIPWHFACVATGCRNRNPGNSTWTGSLRSDAGSLRSDERPMRQPRGGPSCSATSINGSQELDPGRRKSRPLRYARHSKGCASRPTASCRGRLATPAAPARQTSAKTSGKPRWTWTRRVLKPAATTNSSTTSLTLRTWPSPAPKPAMAPTEPSASSPGALPTNPCRITTESGRTSRPSNVRRLNARRA